jgi:hypothetical protein
MATARQTLTLLAALCGAVATSQAPEFAQQYRQRIGGAIDELQRVIAEFDHDAARSRLTREQALETHETAPVQLFRDRGLSTRETIARHERLLDHSERLQSAPAVARPLFVVTGTPDRQLLTGTWRDYEPALPLTAHGLIWTAVGFLFGAAVMRTVLMPFRRRRGEPLPRPQMR